MKQLPFLACQVESDLREIRAPSDLVRITHNTVIKLAILDKKQVLYLTDGYTIIQSQISTYSQKNPHPKPFNKLRTEYYNFHIKHSNIFIFPPQPHQQCSYPSPYDPAFHFQQRIHTFDREEAICSFQNVCQVLVISRWGLKIVNVANTGYYGVVLDVYQYERMRERLTIHQGIHLILYQKTISALLEEFRIRDIKQQIGKPNRVNPISLFYYRKLLKTTHVNKTLQSNFVMADRTGKILTVDLSKKQHYLPIGKLSGVLRFIRPLANYTQCKKAPINFNLFRHVSDIPNKKAEQNQSFKSSTSSSQSQPQPQSQSQHEDTQSQDSTSTTQQIQDSDETSQDEEQQQPLKLIYLKQLKMLNIR